MISRRLSLSTLFLVFFTPLLHADINSDAELIFDYAERGYPSLFSPSGQSTQSSSPYIYRYFSETNTYIGVNVESAEVVVFGDQFGGLSTVGSVSNILGLANKVLPQGISEINISQIIEGVPVTRTVLVRAPQSINPTLSYPILFAFHGAGGRGNQFLQQARLNELINAGEFVGVYPTGHANDGSNGGYWNLGTEATTADDVEFVKMIMEQLASYRILDFSKVYGLGFSNGAGMVNLLGKSTTYFRGIAPLFSHQITSIADLQIKKPLSIFQVSGEIDSLVPINGGESPVGFFLSSEASALNWVSNMNCSSMPVQESFVWGIKTINASTYSSCDSNHKVKSMIALNTPHGWGDRDTDDQSYSEIWAFFESLGQ